MSTLRVTNIASAGGTQTVTQDRLYRGAATAWVNFNGTGTTATNQTIRDSYNVSSVYKNGTGDYTVNFATALANANYSSLVTVENVISGAAIAATTPGGKTASSLRTYSYNTGGAVSDASSYHVATFGGY